MAESLTITEVDEALGYNQESIELPLFELHELGGLALKSTIET